jgi:hypothetical protein
MKFYEPERGAGGSHRYMKDQEDVAVVDIVGDINLEKARGVVNEKPTVVLTSSGANVIKLFSP